MTVIENGSTPTLEQVDAVSHRAGGAAGAAVRRAFAVLVLASAAAVFALCLARP